MGIRVTLSHIETGRFQEDIATQAMRIDEQARILYNGNPGGLIMTITFIKEGAATRFKQLLQQFHLNVQDEDDLLS